jgi:hypothetical protein
MVILVPCLVSQEFVSTGLGLHKSMEMSSSTLSQTLSGLFLDWDTQELIHPHRIVRRRLKRDGDEANSRAARALLVAFLAVNILQLATSILLRYLYRQQETTSEVQREAYQPLAMTPMASPIGTLRHIIEPTSPSNNMQDSLVVDPRTPMSPKRDLTEPSLNFEEADLDEELPASDIQGGAVERRASTAAGRKCLTFVVSYIVLVWIVFWTTMIFDIMEGD